MTDNGIIKALECCKTVNTSDCNNCPYYHEVDCTIYSSCCGTLMTDALSLINRQKAEIERLKKQNEKQRIVLEALDDYFMPLPFETDYDKAIKTAIAEAVKEFAERLKSKHRRILDYDEAGFSAPTNIVYVETIDNLVKEFTEGEKT